MKKYSIVPIIAIMMVSACKLDFGDPGQDKRVGDFGMLRFNGGGGCNDSTSLALGSTARLELEPAHEQPLPADLVPRSSAPQVIGAAQGSTETEVILTAHQVGITELEILAGGGLYDRLSFTAEPAVSADYAASESAYVGGGIIVEINELYGACGEDCPLIGGDFIQWSSKPESAFTVEIYDDRVALLVANQVGSARIIGREPTAGKVLVDHTVDVFPPDVSSELKSKFTVMLPDETLLDPSDMPASLPVGSLMWLELEAVNSDQRKISLAGRDVIWTVVGPAGVVEPWSETADAQPLQGPIYLARAPGQVSLVAHVPMLDELVSFEITVTE
ncbi:MAG: hypothetical protein JRJ87_08845 [Deltaproteobacteria bacterium]|nr:hypothetical protein [Deltaproteobacteria bacterium]